MVRLPGGGPGGGPGGAGNLFFGGEPGIGRMFGMSMGTEASWLLPAALIGLVAGLWLTRRTAAHRPGPREPAALGWLAAGDRRGVQLHGRHHPPVLHRRPGSRRSRRWWASRCASCGGRRDPAAGASRAGGHVRGDRRLGVRSVEPHAGVAACAALGRAGRIGGGGGDACRRRAPAGPGHRRTGRRGNPFRGGRTAAYTVETVATAHNGPMTTSGPAQGSSDSGARGHGPGGPQADNPALAELVEGLDNRWAAASVGSFTVSSLELKTGASIMAIGGFTGGDDSPTLAQFQSYVANDEVRYFIAGERFGPPRPSRWQRQRDHRVGAAELHAVPRRRRHGLRPQRRASNRRDSDSWRAAAVLLSSGGLPSSKEVECP